MNLLNTRPCPYCSSNVSILALKCNGCGSTIPPVNDATINSQNTASSVNSMPSPNTSYGAFTSPTHPQQIHYVTRPNNPTNGLGIAGFIVALCAFLLSWVPVIGWLMWLVGLILSGIAIFKRPRGFAIAGLVISLIWLIIVVVIIGIIGVAIMST